MPIVTVDYAAAREQFPELFERWDGLKRLGGALLHSLQFGPAYVGAIDGDGEIIETPAFCFRMVDWSDTNHGLTIEELPQVARWRDDMFHLCASMPTWYDSNAGYWQQTEPEPYDTDEVGDDGGPIREYPNWEDWYEVDYRDWARFFVGRHWEDILE